MPPYTYMDDVYWGVCRVELNTVGSQIRRTMACPCTHITHPSQSSTPSSLHNRFHTFLPLTTLNLYVPHPTPPEYLYYYTHTDTTPPTPALH